MSDPIVDVISALNLLVAPQPALGDSSTQTPTLWQGGSASTNTAYGVTNTLLQTLFTASGDLTSVSKSINTGVLASVDVLNKLATALGTVAAQGASIQSTLAGVQQALSLAQTLAPGGATATLNQGSALFAKLTDLLTACGGDAKKAANELAALAQLLKKIADLFPH